MLALGVIVETEGRGFEKRLSTFLPHITSCLDQQLLESLADLNKKEEEEKDDDGEEEERKKAKVGRGIQEGEKLEEEVEDEGLLEERRTEDVDRLLFSTLNSLSKILQHCDVVALSEHTSRMCSIWGMYTTYVCPYVLHLMIVLLDQVYTKTFPVLRKNGCISINVSVLPKSLKIVSDTCALRIHKQEQVLLLVLNSLDLECLNVVIAPLNVHGSNPSLVGHIYVACNSFYFLVSLVACVHKLMLHPHSWVRLLSSRLVGLLLAGHSPEELVQVCLEGKGQEEGEAEPSPPGKKRKRKKVTAKESASEQYLHQDTLPKVHN